MTLKLSRAIQETNTFGISWKSTVTGVIGVIHEEFVENLLSIDSPTAEADKTLDFKFVSPPICALDNGIAGI